MSRDNTAKAENFKLRAVQLYTEVNRLTRDYKTDLSPNEQMKRWTLIVSALNAFMRETSGRADTMAALTGLSALLENIATGKPSLADNYKKGGSQQQGIEAQSHLALACVALDLFERAGFDTEESARRVTSMLRRMNLVLTKGNVEWKAILNWRKKLTYGEKNSAVCELYKGFAQRVKDVPAAESEREANLLLETLGELART